MNAIGQLIKKVIGNDKGKKRELALAIAPPGTKKTETALRRLFELINAAERLDAYQEKLRGALGVEDRLFDDAVKDTREQIELEVEFQKLKRRLEYRKKFVPHIFMVGERRVPSQITMCGLTGGNRHRILSLDMEDFKYLTLDEQFSTVRKLIRDHQEEKEGQVMFFGKALAYLYRPTPDGDGVQFDPQGEIEPCDPNNSTHYGDVTICIR